MKIKCKLLRPGVDLPKWWQVKRDGHWICIRRVAEGVRIESALPTDITEKLSWHFCYANSLRLPVGAVLCGELWLPGHNSSAIKTAINDRDGRLRFTAFSAPSLPADLGIPQLNLSLAAYGFATPETFDGPVYGFGDDMPEDVEGYVAKNGNLVGWYKWKPVKTIELICTDTIDGKNANLGLIGSLVCSTYCGCEVASVGGMTKEERNRMTFDENPIGRIIEVKYQEVGPRGRLRFPRFKCFRPDKRRQECVLSQDPDLLEYWSD